MVNVPGLAIWYLRSSKNYRQNWKTSPNSKAKTEKMPQFHLQTIIFSNFLIVTSRFLQTKVFERQTSDQTYWSVRCSGGTFLYKGAWHGSRGSRFHVDFPECNPLWLWPIKFEKRSFGNVGKEKKRRKLFWLWDTYQQNWQKDSDYPWTTALQATIDVWLESILSEWFTFSAKCEDIWISDICSQKGCAFRIYSSANEEFQSWHKSTSWAFL